MKSLNYIDFHKVNRSFTYPLGKLHLRGYVSSGFPIPEAAEHFLCQAAEGRMYKELSKVGLIGVAFLYGFVPKEGSGVTEGIDLAVYRSKPVTENPLTIEIDESLMVHTWTLERPHGKEEFQERDRSRDGTFCAIESVILGRESERLLQAINKAKREGKNLSPARYMGNMNNCPSIDEFKE
ncbi:MAG: hypothetical protein Q8Q31_05185 [Nanoarchaeota archaeon]|nr:hypothetical protein [Nanoarchaeota archaeon]